MIVQLKKIFALLLLVSLGLSVNSQDLQPIPPLTSPVTDLTGTLSRVEVNNLEGALRSFAQTRGSQVVILMVPTTDPEDIASYAIRVAEEWKIGREGIDDGVILLVAKDDRELRIEVGYGLEGAIPDAYAKRIIENLILPEFRNGQFYNGIADGVGAIIGLIEGEDLPAVTRAQQEGADPGDPLGNSLSLLMILAFIGLSIVKSLVKNKGAKAAIAIVIAAVIGLLFANVVLFVVSLILSFILMFASGGSGRGGGIFYGGGFSGGGGGGFGGFSGGGGGFGGGGASGSW